MPSPRPMKPIPSLVLAFTLTSPGDAPSAAASARPWRRRAGPIFGRLGDDGDVALHEGEAALPHGWRSASRRSSMESASFQRGSVSGKSSPMSPAPAAPRMASVSAWATASASEWPARPCGMRDGDAAEHEAAARREAVGVVADARRVSRRDRLPRLDQRVVLPAARAAR